MSTPRSTQKTLHDAIKNQNQPLIEWILNDIGPQEADLESAASEGAWKIIIVMLQSYSFKKETLNNVLSIVVKAARYRDWPRLDDDELLVVAQELVKAGATIKINHENKDSQNVI